MEENKELIQKIIRWRRFIPYIYVSHQIMLLWNRVIKLYMWVDSMNESDIARNAGAIEEKIARYDRDVKRLRKYLVKIKWFRYAVMDKGDLKKAIAYKKYKITFGETFPEILKTIKKIIGVIKRKITISAFYPVVYVYTFVSTRSSSRRQRHIEVHVETYARKCDIDILKKKFEINWLGNTVTEMFVEDLGYDFIFWDNTYPDPNNWRIGTKPKKITENVLKMEIYDIDYHTLRGEAFGDFEDLLYYIHMTAKQIFDSLRVVSYARGQGRKRRIK